MRKLLITAVAGAAAFAGCAAARPAAAPDLHPCATATERCTGTLEVPLNWDDPGSERITVMFLRIPRHDLSTPATGTIMAHFGGGPSPSIGPPERMQQLLDPLGPVLDHQDLVVADMRGLGTSSPQSCTGVHPQRPRTAAGCGEQLGPRAAWFSLDQMVRDYDAVRAALGVERWTVLGNSRGAELAQAYVARFPERTRAVFLNGAAAATPDGYLSPGGPHDYVRSALVTLDRTCEAAPGCAALPGSMADRLDRVATAMRAAGEDVRRLVAVVSNAVFEPRTGRDLQAALQARVDGDPAPLARLLDVVRLPADRPELPPGFAAPLLSYGCSSAQLPFDRTAGLAARRAQLDAFYAEQRPFAPFTWEEAEAGSGLASTVELCVNWPWLRDSAPVDVDAPHPDVPVLQMAGAADPTTVDAATIGERFPQHTLVRIPGGFHQSWDDEHPTDGWCPREVMRAFLTDPQAPIPGGCDRTTLRPLGAFPRTATEVPAVQSVALTPARAVLAAVAHATAVDSTVPRHPTDPPAGPEFVQAGVRGGTATGAADGTVALAGYRFVEDVTVDGTVTVEPAGTASATLTLTAPDGPHDVTLTWPLFDPAPEVTGTVDGTSFTAG
jgi:pimeloyl-ACP methyl ester carboxylesterase